MSEKKKVCRSCLMGTHARCRQVLAIRADLLNARPMTEADKCECRCRTKKRRPQHDTSSSPYRKQRGVEF
jgi:hypothetical protein